MGKNLYQPGRFMVTLITLALSTTLLTAQVAINSDGSSPDNSAMLDVKSSDKGILIPRLTTIQRTTLASTAVAGLMVYDTDVNKFFFFNGLTWDEGSVGNLWSSNGLSLYPTNAAGKIGIGFSTPSYDIDVNRTAAPAFMRLKSTSGYAGLIIEKASPSHNGYIIFRHAGADDWYVGTVKNTDFAISTSYSAADGKFYIEQSTGNVGIGTTTPARTLEVSGPWKTARISSTAPGATLEFVSTVKNDWAITTWNGDMAFLYSTDDFVTRSDEYYFTPTSIYPYSSNANSLGLSAKRWSNLYSAGGNFSGNGLGIPSATVYTVNSATTGGIAGYFETNGSDATMVLKQNGTGYFLKGFGSNGGNEEWAVHGDGYMEFFNSNHNRTISIDPSETGTADAGQITMYSADGLTPTIEIDGGWGGPNGRITTNELQITGGSDLSEYFDLTHKESIKEGMVVSIDTENPGHLTVSQYAYDKKVAGIVSGANSIKPGLMMSQKGTIADGEHLIALSGRVYCLADATKAPIEIGDLLTTSDIPGHAMKVEDFDKARGAIIGKAMTSLKSGEGLVLVLVSLQ